MSLLHLALRSLVYHLRSNAAVALGVIAATAVLTGALIVGDSVRGSLRKLVVDRLGHVDDALVTTRFFRQDLAAELSSAQAFREEFACAVPAIMLPGTLENPIGMRHRRASNVAVLGAGADFWQLGRGEPAKPPGPGEVVLNQPLAEQLAANVGDEVVLRLPQAANVPADSPLGRKTETVRSRRLIVSAVIPATGLGRFGLRPSQQLPLNAFTSLLTLQQMLEVSDQANAVFVSQRKGIDSLNAKSEQALQGALHPLLADYGITIHETPRGYFSLISDRMLIEPGLEAAALKTYDTLHPQPVLTYLANYILAGDGLGKIPYSTIAAIDWSNQPPLGPLLNREGQPIGAIGADEIVLNAWAADDLAAQGVLLKPGDAIEITYFEPESTHGKIVESRHMFRLKDITPLAGVAEDRDLTPEVKGVTDEDSIADWHPPFPYDQRRVRSTPPHNQDDNYWKQHRATPKAFICLDQGRKLWGSRFGKTTSIRIPSQKGITADALTNQLERELKPAALGFEFLPVKRLSLTAAEGTTPFAVLFLAFSMFIIGAALMLLAVLFKLGVDGRTTELGIVLAIGWRRHLARRMMLIEGACIALLGALVGIAVGIAYAWLMLTGLKTWWLGAISTPFLELYVQPVSMVIGYASGVLVSLATIVWALRQTRQVPVRRLLTGQLEEDRFVRRGRRRRMPWLIGGLLASAVAMGVSGAHLSDESQAGAFMGVGAMILAALLVGIWSQWRIDSHASFIGGRVPLVRLAIRNGSRHPLRSTLTLGLVATACFLIVAVSAFQLAPPSEGPAFESGDGGFALVAQSDQPIYQDLNLPMARQELGFNESNSTAVKNGVIFPLRVESGDDASCLNLYQSRQPRILGVPQTMIDRGGFAWAVSVAESDQEKENPWLVLRRTSSAAGPIPVVLDQNTAMYGLHLYHGAGETFEIDNPRGGKLQLQVVGLLKNSIFQGDLLIREDDFKKLFPETSGYRLFLIAAPPQGAAQVAESLESSLGDYGFTTQTTAARLSAFYEVQNTYLATFRSLGGLGLLLGTFGLAAVQLRSIVERRGELALLRATGFRRRRLAQLVLLENASLLIGGLAVGVIAALIALLPHLWTGGAAIPWRSLMGMLAIVLAVGLLAGFLSVRAVLRSPLLAALRGS